MELILVIIIIGLLCLILRSLRKPKRRIQEQYTPPPAPRPFNAKARIATPVRKIIQGRAYVVDGDTVIIQKTQIRLFGVDAPEMNHPYGIKAKWALFNLCKGEVIRAEITDLDHYGRTVAICRLPDGRDLAAEMVKCGLAIDWPKYSGGKYTPFEVKDARRKMWLADARQKGRMYVWDHYEARQAAKSA